MAESVQRTECYSDTNRWQGSAFFSPVVGGPISPVVGITVLAGIPSLLRWRSETSG